MRERFRKQAAMTLTEMMVAMSLLGAVVAVFGPVLASAFNSVRVSQNESRAIDEIRVAVARIDRELRSAECIVAPGEGDSGAVLTFTTHADTAGEYSVSYAVDETGRLTRTVGADTSYVGEGIVVTSEEFQHAANPGQRSKVTIDLQVRFEDDHDPRNVTTVIAGRNAWGTCN